MANKFNAWLKGIGSMLYGGEDRNLADYQHASRLYVEDNFRLAPKTKFLYYVVFNINPNATQDISFEDRHNLELNYLVKSTDLPKYTIKTETLNQYNRKTNVYTNIIYDPINMKFHDDNNGITNMMWALYYSYYFADRMNAMDDGIAPAAYARNTYESKNRMPFRYGLDNGSDEPFFDSIQLFTLSRQRFFSYLLCNPKITKWDHDTMDQSEGNGIVQNSMTIAYDAVIYNSGAVDVDDPTGFAVLHYDTTPSPIINEELWQNGMGGIFGDSFSLNTFASGNSLLNNRFLGTGWGNGRNYGLSGGYGIPIGGNPYGNAGGLLGYNFGGGSPYSMKNALIGAGIGLAGRFAGNLLNNFMNGSNQKNDANRSDAVGTDNPRNTRDAYDQKGDSKNNNETKTLNGMRSESTETEKGRRAQDQLLNKDPQGGSIKKAQEQIAANQNQQLQAQEDKQLAQKNLDQATADKDAAAKNVADADQNIKLADAEMINLKEKHDLGLISDQDYADGLDKANLEKSQAITERNQAQSDLTLQEAKILDSQEQIQASDQRIGTLQSQEKTLQENVSAVDNNFNRDPDKESRAGDDTRGSGSSSNQGFTDDSGNYHPGVETPNLRNSGEGATPDPARTPAVADKIAAADQRIAVGKEISETQGQLINTNKEIIDNNKSQAQDLRSQQADVRAQQQTVQEKYDNGQISAAEYKSQTSALNAQNQSLGNQAVKLEREANSLASENEKLSKEKDMIDSQVAQAEQQKETIINQEIEQDTANLSKSEFDPNPDAPVGTIDDSQSSVGGGNEAGYDNNNSDVPDYQAYESNYPSDDQSYEANYPYESSSSDNSSSGSAYEDNYSYEE